MTEKKRKISVDKVRLPDEVMKDIRKLQSEFQADGKSAPPQGYFVAEFWRVWKLHKDQRATKVVVAGGADSITEDESILLEMFRAKPTRGFESDLMQTVRSWIKESKQSAKAGKQ